MATLHVASTGADRSLEKQGWKSPRLPEIVHPMQRAEDRSTLAVQGLSSRRSINRDAHGGLNLDASSRPATCPENNFGRGTSRTCNSRPATSLGPSTSAVHLGVDELLKLTSEKLRGGTFFAFRHAFRSFDPQGNGTVSREALYRILCNFLDPGITRQQFAAILSKLELAQKKVISFEDFFSRFHVSESQPRWLDPVTRHSPRMMTALQVHSQLKEKARQKILTLSDFLPTSRGPPSLITKPEFRNMLATLSFHMQDEEFEKLWKRYDPAQKGVLSVPSLLKELGITIATHTAAPRTKSPTKGASSAELWRSSQTKAPPLPADVLESLQSTLDATHQQMLHKLQEVDKYKSEKVTAEQLRVVLSDMGVKLTPAQMSELIGRLGFRDNFLIDYAAFLQHFNQRGADGLVNSVLTNTEQKFHVDSPGRACTSVGDAEARIVSLLQSKFLDLLGALKSHDPRAKGYIREEEFVQCLHTHLGSTSMDASVGQLVKVLQSGGVPPGWVPYPRFLAMFESKEQQQQLAKRSFSSQSTSLQASPEKPSSPRKLPTIATLDKLIAAIREVVLRETNALTQVFISIDTQNTGKLTLPMMVELLQRFGVTATEAEMNVIWESLLKNKNGTTNFHEFLRQFASRPATTASKPGKRLTEDHYFMRSKTLHRDEDMLQDALKAKISYYSPSLLSHFKTMDTNNSGKVSSHLLQETLLELCPGLMERELAELVAKIQDRDAQVDYVGFVSMFSRPHETYRTGNNMRRLLAGQKPKDAIADTSPPLILAAQPPSGLPGVKAQLQKQLSSYWRILRRHFRSADPSSTGSVTVLEFRSILAQCGIHITSDQMYHILEALDPHLSGRVDYRLFTNIILDQ